MGKGLRYYDLNDLSAKSDGSHIVDGMEKLLSDYDKLDSMAEAGKRRSYLQITHGKTVQKKNLWNCFCDEMLYVMKYLQFKAFQSKI